MRHLVQVAMVAAALASGASDWVNPPPDSNSPPGGVANQFPAPPPNTSAAVSHTPTEAAKTGSSLPPVAKRVAPHTRAHQPAHVRDNRSTPSKIARGNDITTWLNRQELMRIGRRPDYPMLPGRP